MKILHCTAQLPMRTGSGVYFSILLEGLTKLGYENAALYGTQNPYTERLFTQKLLKKIKTYPVDFLSESLPFPIVGMSDIMPYEATKYSEMSDAMFETWQRQFIVSLNQARNEFKPNIIIVHHAFILASLVQKVFSDRKIICICHGTDIRQIRQNPQLKEKYIFNLEKIRNYCTVSPKSTLDLKEIFSIPEENINLLGGGFNPKIFNTNGRKVYGKKNPKKDTFKILYAGKIAESKGVFELVKSVDLILEEYPHASLSLVGNTRAEQMQRLNASIKNNKHVKFYNALDQKELARLFKTYDLFVMPSYYETLGLIAIEALACAIRVVATEIEGLQNLLGNDINKSGSIEYVKLPRLYDTDKAVEEDKAEFVKNLSKKIILQLNRISCGENIPADILDKINDCSWNAIIQKLDGIIKKISLV